ncbi:TPA: hypothetical protein ACQUHN_004152 [Bacillus thuringiensis]|uniref:hypothetical protein n=1 Tax=Bacillus sp. RZ2MS9 TaxID=1806216 RepID=UPI00143FCE2C|nr:hypothetical protein [Bacillus sp. RZ2MS9]QIZ41379.1 hypothetical protein BHV55_06715 [Bacillus sp. RZ2MS9]
MSVVQPKTKIFEDDLSAKGKLEMAVNSAIAHKELISMDTHVFLDKFGTAKMVITVIVK